MRTKYAISARASIVEVARDLVDGRVGVLEGARRIDHLRYDLEDPGAAMLAPIRAVASNRLTSLNAVGHLAKSAGWRHEIAAEAERFAAEVRADVLSACRAVLVTYAEEIMLAAIGDVLGREGEPVGPRSGSTTHGVSHAHRAREIVAMLNDGKSQAEIVDFLWRSRAARPGLDGDRVATRRLADALLRLRRPDGPPELAVDLIYVRLAHEGASTMRPVASYRVSENEYILDEGPPPDEAWEFPGGARVVAEERELVKPGMPEIRRLVAVGRVPEDGTTPT